MYKSHVNGDTVYSYRCKMYKSHVNGDTLYIVTDVKGTTAMLMGTLCI